MQAELQPCEQSLPVAGFEKAFANRLLRPQTGREERTRNVTNPGSVQIRGKLHHGNLGLDTVNVHLGAGRFGV